jgi:hypothetical protein
VDLITVSMLISVLALFFYFFRMQANWRQLWADYRSSGKMGCPAGRTP